MSHHWARITKDQWRRVLSVLGTLTTEEGIDEDLIYQFNQEDMGFEIDEDASGPPLPIDTTPPATPTGLVAVGGLKAISLDWDDNLEPDFAEYQLEISTETDFSIRVAFLRGRVSFAHWEGDHSETYYARIRAVDTSGNASPWSSSVNASTGPAPIVPDGNPPSSSPTPSVVGLPGSIFAYWNPISNADLVTYEVHIIDETSRAGNSGWAVGTSTYGGEGVKTRAIVKDKNGTPLSEDVNYYLKTVAKDDDGAAAASAEAGPITINEEGTITANMFEAILIWAKIMELYDTEGNLTIDLDGTTGLITVAPNGVFSLQLGDLTFPIRYWDGSTINRFYLDSDGGVYVSGRVDWGLGSRLTQDFIELIEKTATAVEPQVVQSRTLGPQFAPTTNLGIDWPSPTTHGNLLLFGVTADAGAGGTAPTINTPSGWTLIHTVANGPIRQSIFKIEGAASRSGTQVVTVSTAALMRLTLVELSGVATASAQDRATTNSGTGNSLSTGTTATTTQAEEVFIALFSHSEGNLSLAEASGWTTITREPSSSLVTYMAFKTVTATQTASAATTRTGGTGEWVASIVTFKAALSGTPPTPPANYVRVYAKDRGGSSALYFIDDTGREWALGGGFGFRVYRSAALSHTSSANWQQINFDASRFNDSGMFDLTADRLTIPISGRWQLLAKVDFNSNTNGDRRGARAVLDPAGTPIVLDSHVVAQLAVGSEMIISVVEDFSQGDVIQLEGFQNTGGSLGYNVGLENLWFAGMLIGPS